MKKENNKLPNFTIYEYVKPEYTKLELEHPQIPEFFGSTIIPKLDFTLKEKPIEVREPETEPEPSVTYRLLSSAQRQAQFNKYYDEIEQEDPNAKQYRALLTAIADHESRLNPQAKNPNAPAYGYFQFMQDDEKWNNISKYAGMTIEDFLKDPKSQIRAAIKLAKAFSNSISSTAREVSTRRGITESGLIGGAWLGGANGVNRYLIDGRDASDAYWYGGKGGSKISEAIQRYNKL